MAVMLKKKLVSACSCIDQLFKRIFCDLALMQMRKMRTICETLLIINRTSL